MIHSIHWGVSGWRQKARFERYADDSWALIVGIGRAYVALKGRRRSLPRLPKGTVKIGEPLGRISTADFYSDRDGSGT